MPPTQRIDKLIQRNRTAHKGSFLYEDAEWLREAYVERGLSIRQVADEAECGIRTVCRWMAKHGIQTDPTRQPRRRRGPEHPGWKGGPPSCPKCGGARAYGAATCVACRSKEGIRNPNWRGAAIGYGAAHERVRATRGEVSQYQCEHCRTKPAQHWAYDHQDPEAQVEEGKRDKGPYSSDPSRYVPLCVPCHKRFDLARLKDVSGGEDFPASDGVEEGRPLIAGVGHSQAVPSWSRSSPAR
jgi:hypothetical protein